MTRPARPPARGDPRDRGAAVIEFAGMFPLVLLMMGAIWQCILIGYTFSLAANAADEGARAGAGARSGAQAACAEAAAADLPAAWEATGIHCGLAEGDTVRTAEVVLEVPVLFPGAFHLPFSVTGTAGAAEEGQEEGQ